jgi:hypothetical protein
MENHIRLTGAQIRVLNGIIDEHDPPMVDIEDTNLKGVYLFSYRVGPHIAIMAQVLVSADGHTMEVG